MITRFEQDDDALSVESCHEGGKTTLLGLVLGSLLAMLILVLVNAALFALLPPTQPSLPPRIVAMFLALLLFPVFFIPRFLRGSEHMELRGTKFVHQRFVGSMRRSRDEYDLLQMRGLRTTQSLGPQMQLEGVGVGFWYKSGPRWFGDTLDESERDRVVESMLHHDRRVRESLGMRPEDGLANSGYWDTPVAREAMLQELYSDQRFMR